MNDYYDMEPWETNTRLIIINDEIVDLVDLSFCCRDKITEEGVCAGCGEEQ